MLLLSVVSNKNVITAESFVHFASHSHTHKLTHLHKLLHTIFIPLFYNNNEREPPRRMTKVFPHTYTKRTLHTH